MRTFCRCDVCRKFRRDGDYGWFQNLRAGSCDICRAVDVKIAPWVPDILQEFLDIKQMCWACRNGIDCYMGEWALCWAKDSDEAIKWALCDWVLRHYFSVHFYPHAYAWVERGCCEKGHGAGGAQGGMRITSSKGAE